VIILEREREREREREDKTSTLFFSLTDYSGFLFAKKLTSLVVSIILVTSLFAGGVFLRPQIVHAADDANGECGTSLTWVFTGATGNLTISGTGAMAHYDMGGAPWYSFRTSITSLTLNPGITTISNHAFYSCTALTGELTIPIGVTTISARAFYECSKLTGDLTIPEGVETIGIYAFYKCTAFTGELTIPASVTNIGSYAFQNCSGLTGELTIPDGVTSIGESAFYSCTGLTGEVTIPASVTNIVGDVFRGIGSTDINVNSGNANYASIDGILYNKALTTLIQYPAGKVAAFTSLNIPSSVENISYSAFYGCTNLTGELTIPTSVTSIGSSAFYGCTGLTGNLTIPAGVSIGMWAFYGCNKLESVIIPDSVTTIGSDAFYSTSSGFVINCHYGSAAETYAKSAGKKYNNLYDAEISGVVDAGYTGSEVTQTSIVVAAKTFANPAGITITEDEDYTVSYLDNISAGTATMTITGMGNYKGTVSAQFEIGKIIKVNLTPDALSKNAGYDGHIDVSLKNAAGDQAYAMAIPMVFDNDTIEITDLETVDFAAKNLTGLLVNGTFLSGAYDYDSSSEVLSVINSEGKFLLSWTVEEAIPLVPHTLTDDVYFTIHYRVKENVPTSASFAIGEYNIDNGIDQDQIFGVDGLGILSSNQEDFGAYLLVDGEYGILTQKYINLLVEDMPAVTISGDVNSISLQGRAMLTGKQRTPISAVGYTPNLNKMDAGIRVEMYEVDDGGDIVKQVGSVAYTQEMNMTAAIGDPSSNLYNYTLNIPRTVANDLVSSDPDQSSPKYMLRFSRFGDNGGSVVGTVREESYLWADIYLDGTSVNTGTIDEAIPLTVGGTAYLYAGAFYLPTAEKFAITASDLNTIKGQVGNADISGVTTIYNINEYLGVDAADYTTVLRYVGKTKLQPLPLVVSN
jgi:hypothetical protein